MPLVPSDGRFDHQSLERALELAEHAQAFASPNPSVGCVLASEADILGDGAHLYDNRDHAEIAALKAAALAGKDVRGATAYVTLEPCSHHGRTGPCAEALVQAGIARCVIATVDPNPLVRGGGLAKLRSAGVAVHVLPPASPLASRARRLNDAFAFSVQNGRPFVTLKTAVSADGKVAPAPRLRTQTAPFWLTGEAARQDVQRLRHRSDALITGTGTVLADDPSLTDRTGLPRRRPLLRVVLDSSLQIPETSRLVQTAREDLLVLCTTDVSTQKVERLRSKGVTVRQLAGEKGRLPLPDVLATLAGLSLRSVLLEAGPALNRAFLEQDLVDELFTYQSSSLLGSEALPFASGVDLDSLRERLQRSSLQTFPHGTSQDLRTSGYLHDPWTGVN